MTIDKEQGQRCVALSKAGLHHPTNPMLIDLEDTLGNIENYDINCKTNVIFSIWQFIS